MRGISLISASVASMIGAGSLVIWPIGFLEGWKCDGLISLLLAAAMVLFVLACHCLDVEENRLIRQRALTDAVPDPARPDAGSHA